MRREAAVVALVILVAAGLSVGYLAGNSTRTTQTTVTSTSTSIITSTLTSQQTVLVKTTVQNNYTTTITSALHSAGQPIPIASVETANITMRGSPYIIGVNPDGSRVYVTYGLTNGLIIIDASSHKVISNVTLTTSITNIGIAIDYNANMYYVSMGVGGIAKINGSTNQVVGILPVNLRYLAYDPLTHILYGASRNWSIVGVDVRTGSIVANVSLGYSVGSVTLNPKMDMIYAVGCSELPIACDAMGSIVNGTSKTLVTTFPIYSYSESTLTINPRTNVLYVSGGGQLRALNGTNGDVIFVSFPKTCILSGMTVIPSSGRVLAIPWMYNYLSVYNGTSGTLVNMYSFPSSPISVAYDPNTDEVFVTLPGQFLSFHDFPIDGNVDSILIGSSLGCAP